MSNQKQEWIMVEFQAGAGSDFEIFHPDSILAIQQYVESLTQQNIKHHIYEIIEVEELEFAPATLIPKRKTME
jgi:hypothetical protein